MLPFFHERRIVSLGVVEPGLLTLAVDALVSQPRPDRGVGGMHAPSRLELPLEPLQGPELEGQAQAARLLRRQIHQGAPHLRGAASGGRPPEVLILEHLETALVGALHPCAAGLSNEAGPPTGFRRADLGLIEHHHEDLRALHQPRG